MSNVLPMFPYPAAERFAIANIEALAHDGTLIIPLLVEVAYDQDTWALTIIYSNGYRHTYQDVDVADYDWLIASIDYAVHPLKLRAMPRQQDDSLSLVRLGWSKVDALQMDRKRNRRQDKP